MNQAYIRLSKDIFSRGVDSLALFYNTISSFLGTPNKVSTRMLRVFCEFLQSYLTNPTGSSHKESNETSGKGGRNKRIGRDNGGKRNHYEYQVTDVMRDSFISLQKNLHVHI
jgi:hypothetical protein